MSELGLGEDARAVLEAGRSGDEPRPGDRARIRAALMGAIAAGGAGAASMVGEGAALAGAGGTAKSAVGAASALSMAAAWKAALVGVAMVSALGAGYLTAPPPSQASPRAVSRIAEPAATVTVAPAKATPGASALADPVAAPAAPPAAASAADPTSAPLPARGAPLASPASPASPPHPSATDPAPAAVVPADSLEAETRRLGEAHGALNGGDPARALVLLDEQAATYAQGQLREERAAARILALCKLGRVDEARALAAQFAVENPRSPLGARVRAACAAGDPR